MENLKTSAKYVLKDSDTENKMIKNTKKPKRCTKCRKIIDSKNESGLCSHHYQLAFQKKKKKEKKDEN